MSEESLTLYKLMILYMLDNLEFPMTTSQLSEFFVNKGYTSYFHLQQAINELHDARFIRGDVVRNTTNYYLTASGQEALDMFLGKIPEPIKIDIMDYFSLKKGEYMVKTQIKEKGSTLLELYLNVVSKEQAIEVCDKWSEKCESVYSKVMELLLLDK